MQSKTEQPIRVLQTYVLFSTGNLHASQLCVTGIDQSHSLLRTSSRLVHRVLICHSEGQCEQESRCYIEIESLTQSCSINRLLNDCVHTSFIVLYLLAAVLNLMVTPTICKFFLMWWLTQQVIFSNYILLTSPPPPTSLQYDMVESVVADARVHEP